MKAKKAIKAIYKKDLDRIQKEHKEMSEALKGIREYIRKGGGSLSYIINRIDNTIKEIES